jgi:hypothetical protein
MATQEYSASVEDERGHYVVVMQAPAGFYFGRNDPLNTMQFPSLLGPVEITFGTARTRLDGFENPVRAGLWADARGNAPTLSEAVEVFANFTRGVAAVLSVAANAPVGRFTADLAFDNTPGRHEREYFRQSYPADPQVPSQGRRLDSSLALALFTGWMQKPVKELERWHRAANAYHHALQEWDPGAEIPAMSHLWTVVEALTPIVRRRYMQAESLTRDQLLARWGIELNDLDPEVRRRLLFQGDDACYSTAREARNALLHGYDPLWEVREGSLEVRDLTASYVRQALIGSVDLGEANREALLARPYDRPFHWAVETFVFGRMLGDVENPARSGDVYPRVDWWLQRTELPPDAEGDARVDFNVGVAPQLADGMSFVLDRVQLMLPRDDENRAEVDLAEPPASEDDARDVDSDPDDVEL